MTTFIQPPRLQTTLAAFSLSISLSAAEATSGFDRAQLSPHSNAISQERKQGKDADGLASELLNQASIHYESGDFTSALPLQRRALAIQEKVLGPEHPQTAQALTDMALTKVALAQYEQALPLQWRALAIREKVLGPEHPDTAMALNNLAATHGALAQHDRALPLQRRALVIREKVLGPEHPDTAMALHNLAWTHRSLAQYDQALPLQRRALVIQEKMLGPEHPDTAMVLNNLALIHYSLAQHNQALPLQRRALAIWEKVLGPDHPDTALALNNLALTHDALAQHDQALPLQRRALAIWEKVLGQDHPETALALHNLASTHGSLAQHDQALPLQSRALAIREKVLGPEHPDTALALYSLAATHSSLAQHDQALPLLRRALAIWEKVLGPEHPDTAMALNNLAWTHGILGQHDQALPLLRRALAIREEVLGPEHPETALALHNLASTNGSLAQHDQALPLQRRALAIWEKVLGPEHPSTADALNSLAWTYRSLAQYDQALPFQRRALAIWEKVLGPEHPDTARALNNLAWNHSLLTQYDQALPLHRRALAIWEKVLGPEHPDTAWALNYLGLSYISLAQYDQALPLLQRALAIWEKVLGPEHPDTGAALKNLARIHEALAQHDLAFQFGIRALAIFEQFLDLEHPFTAEALSGLAHLLKVKAQPDAAVSLYKTAVNAYQAQRERVSRIDEDTLRSYTESISGTYQSLADLLVDQGRFAEAQQVLDMLKEDEVFEFIRRSGNADPRQTRIAYTPTEARWAKRYREVADRLASLGAEERQLQHKAKQGLSPKEKARLDTLKADLEVAEEAFMAFLGDMQQRLTAQGPSKVDEVAATSVDAQRELQKLIGDLGPNVVLLQYYVTNDKVGMLLTTTNVVIPFSSEIDAKKLNRDIFDFRRALRDPKTDIVPASQALYKLLMSPVADALDQAGAKTVMLSLDGNLRHLPFGALHDGKQFVAQRWNLPVYTAVTRDKLREGSSTRWRAAGLGVTRAIGEFKALPAVKVEMDGLLRASGGGASQSVVYLDDQFTATKLKEVGQRDFQLMHISSHFSISPGTEVSSFLLLGDGQRLTLGDIRTQNYRFDNVDLLTLSACDTGLGGGRDANGREIEGLGVIAQQQGAKGVLATLWPVADGSTAKMMADMYQRRQSRGLSKIEALRQAQLALMSEPRYSHPFYWAPFILLGNWQ